MKFARAKHHSFSRSQPASVIVSDYRLQSIIFCCAFPQWDERFCNTGVIKSLLCVSSIKVGSVQLNDRPFLLLTPSVSGRFLPRDAMHPRYSPWPCVRPSVCPSVTCRSSTKTAKRKITQTTPHDSPGTLVFWSQRSPRNSTGVTPYGGAKCRWGGSKSSTFDK